MKKLSIVFLLIFSFLNVMAENSKKIEVKSAHIEYESVLEFSMNMGNGDIKKELKTNVFMDIDDYGKKMSIRTVGDSMDLDGEKVDITTIINGNKTYTLDNITKTYIISEDEEDSEDDSSEDDANKKIGSEKILGKTCDILEAKEDESYTKIWMWKGIALKTSSELKLGGMTISKVNQVAKKLTEGNVKSSVFEIPSGYSENKEAMEAMQEYQDNMENFSDYSE